VINKGICQNQSFGWRISSDEFPNMLKYCIEVLTMFGSTYDGEVVFQAMTAIKPKKRNLLIDECLGNLITAAVTEYQAQIKIKYYNIIKFKKA